MGLHQQASHTEQNRAKNDQVVDTPGPGVCLKNNPPQAQTPSHRIKRR
jgi:hypothetical protein